MPKNYANGKAPEFPERKPMTEEDRKRFSVDPEDP